MEPEDVPQNHSRAPGVYRDRAGWRTVINCALNIPGIGSAQHHAIKRWRFDTPLEEMQHWRVEEKVRIEAELQAQLDAAFRELAELKAAKPPRLNPRTPAASFSELKEELHAARRQIAELKETAARLHDALHIERRRAELAEEATRRAYRGFAAAGARR